MLAGVAVFAFHVPATRAGAAAMHAGAAGTLGDAAQTRALIDLRDDGTVHASSDGGSGGGARAAAFRLGWIGQHSTS